MRTRVGKIEQTSVKYDLLKRGTYTMNAHARNDSTPVKTDKKLPLQLLEAENAVQIAQLANADQYAKDTYDSAQNLLRQAEAYQARNAGSKPVIMTSREAVQNAETSRLLALQAAGGRTNRAREDRQRRIAKRRLVRRPRKRRARRQWRMRRPPSRLGKRR